MSEISQKALDQILTAGAQQFQKDMTDIGGNIAVAHNLARLGVTTRFNEIGPVESRAVSGVMATPIAGPTTQAAG